MRRREPACHDEGSRLPLLTQRRAVPYPRHLALARRCERAFIDWLSFRRNHTPMTPLERAARAICHDFGVDPDYTMTDEDDVHVGFGFKPPHPAWTRYVSLARAAFLAVRDPSEAMIYAHSEGGLGFNDKVIEDWQAMIDAMLEEQPAISRR